MKGLFITLGVLLVGIVIFNNLYQGLSNNREITNTYLNEQVEKSESKEEMEAMNVSAAHNTAGLPENPNIGLEFVETDLEDLYLAGGCFWGLEAYMARIYGVYDVTSGYANGDTENPSYEDLIFKGSGHAETVHVRYDPNRVDIETLMTYYLKVVDPTSLNKQGNDRGSQYRTGIYYTDEKELPLIQAKLEKEQMKYEKEIVIEVQPLVHYYLAEDYHQDYLEKNPNGYCHIDLNEVKDVILDESSFVKPSDEEIKAMLTDLQYKVTQNDGTERPFDNAYWDNKVSGLYVDIVTGEPLFSSKDKYKSGTGWPSFTQPINEDVVSYHEDKKLTVTRVEIRSKIGDSHLGHVFEDGPVDKGGLRYCMNSASMNFIPLEDLDEMGYGYLKYLIEE